MEITKANKSHYCRIIEIYNWAIENTVSTFDTELKTIENYSTFLDSFEKYPLIVALNSDGEVTGLGCLKAYSDRKAYDETSELSVYIDPTFHSLGIGKSIMSQLLLEANEMKLHTIISRVTKESIASIKLHEKFGFKQVGVLKEVGYKFNKRVDVLFMQKFLK